MCIWTKTQVFAETQLIFSKLRVKSGKTQVFGNKLLKILQKHRTSTLKRGCLPTMSIKFRQTQPDFPKLRSRFGKTQVKKRKTQVRLLKNSGIRKQSVYFCLQKVHKKAC